MQKTRVTPLDRRMFLSVCLLLLYKRSRIPAIINSMPGPMLIVQAVAAQTIKCLIFPRVLFFFFLKRAPETQQSKERSGFAKHAAKRGSALKYSKQANLAFNILPFENIHKMITTCVNSVRAQHKHRRKHAHQGKGVGGWGGPDSISEEFARWPFV